MRVGVTGTRSGMTDAQKEMFKILINTLTPTHFSHGDCVGVDDQAADIVYLDIPSCRIICHPPLDNRLRAFNNKHTEIRDAKTHFARNRAIVDESDLVIVVPFQSAHQSHGGTWYTHDYAVKKNKTIFTLWPDGSYADNK